MDILKLNWWIQAWNSSFKNIFYKKIHTEYFQHNWIAAKPIMSLFMLYFISNEMENFFCISDIFWAMMMKNKNNHMSEVFFTLFGFIHTYIYLCRIDGKERRWPQLPIFFHIDSIVCPIHSFESLYKTVTKLQHAKYDWTSFVFFFFYHLHFHCCKIEI